MVGKGSTGEVVLRVGGSIVGMGKAMDADIKRVVELGAEPPPYGSALAFSGTATISDESINMLKGMFMEQLPMFDVVTTQHRHTPPRKIRSKKKRLRKKWAKQFEASIGSRTTYKNVSIEGVHMNVGQSEV